MGQTVVEKLAEAHLSAGPPRPLRAGDAVTLRPRHVLTHDNTAAVLKKFRRLGAPRVFDPGQPVFALDHDIQNASPENLAKYAEIEAFAREQGVAFHPAGAGIGHQLMVEGGYARPGALVVASDSHANTYGALGALGTPVVRTDAAAIWATGTFWWFVPPSVQVVLEGELREGVSGKDVILTLCGLYDRGEVLNAALEFTGPGIVSLDMAARLTIANMTTEWGALTGWFEVDATTLAFLDERRSVLEGRGANRLTRAQIEGWRSDPPAPDPDARYAARIILDLTRVTPQVAGPHTVHRTRPAAALHEAPQRVDKAYLLSCVNGRLQDLEAAAGVLAGRRVAPGVELYVAAASREVQEAAEASGVWDTLVAAGAKVLPPGCGPCIGLGAGLLEPGEVGISATNRNFRGRMGSPEAEAYLASPAVVAASAMAGVITAPPEGAGPGSSVSGSGGEPGGGTPGRRLVRLPEPERLAGAVDLVDGFPERIVGRLAFVPKANLDTDGIYSKDHTYRHLTAAEMANVVMANYDPDFRRRARAGDILVGSRNFGTGSSREQAATALLACGVRAIVAASFSQTFRRNAFNNGLLCLECPDLARYLEIELAPEIEAGELTVIPGDDLEIELHRATVAWHGHTFDFPPLGPVPQELIAAGGVERLVARVISRTKSPSA